MRVLVCGGRSYTNRQQVADILDGVHRNHGPITCIIHGQADGADFLGAMWGCEKGIPREPYPADWVTHGKRAGPIRNQQMIDQGKPDLVVAFPGGQGTRDMVRRAVSARIHTLEVGPA